MIVKFCPLCDINLGLHPRTAIYPCEAAAAAVRLVESDIVAATRASGYDGEDAQRV